MTCALSKDSDQPEHLYGLHEGSLGPWQPFEHPLAQQRLWSAWGVCLVWSVFSMLETWSLWAHSTAETLIWLQISKLIWIFSEHKCHIVCFSSCNLFIIFTFYLFHLYDIARCVNCVCHATYVETTITRYLLVTTADKLCKRLGPRLGWTKCRPWIQIVGYFDEFFDKRNLIKIRQNKKHGKLTC